MSDPTVPPNEFIEAVTRFINELEDISDSFLSISKEIETAADIFQAISDELPDLIEDIAKHRKNLPESAQEVIDQVSNGNKAVDSAADSSSQPDKVSSYAKVSENSTKPSVPPTPNTWKLTSESDWMTPSKKHLAKAKTSNNTPRKKFLFVPEGKSGEKSNANKIPTDTKIEKQPTNGESNSDITSSEKNTAPESKIANGSDEKSEDKEKLTLSGLSIEDIPLPPGSPILDSAQEPMLINGEVVDPVGKQTDEKREEPVNGKVEEPPTNGSVDIPSERKPSDGTIAEQVTTRPEQSSKRRNSKQTTKLVKTEQELARELRQERQRYEQEKRMMKEKVVAYFHSQNEYRECLTPAKCLAVVPFLHELLVFVRDKNEFFGPQRISSVLQGRQQLHKLNNTEEMEKLSMFYLILNEMHDASHCASVIQEDFSYLMTQTSLMFEEVERSYYKVVCETKRWHHTSYLTCRMLKLPVEYSANFKKVIKEEFTKRIAAYIDDFHQRWTGKRDSPSLESEALTVYRFALDARQSEVEMDEGIVYMKKQLEEHREKARKPIAYDSIILADFYQYLVKAKDEHQLLHYDSMFLSNLAPELRAHWEWDYMLVVLTRIELIDV